MDQELAFFMENPALLSVMNSLFDGIYVVDRKRRIVFWNKGAEEITGYSEDEVIGRCCADDILNHIDENGHLLCRGRCPLAKTLLTGECIQAKVYPLHKSGHRFPVKTHIAPLRDVKGDIIAGIEVFRDISSEEEFRVLQEKFNKLVQKYLSDSTFEEIKSQLESGASTQARQRDLTVLYIDIVGFTVLSERNKPQDIVQMLNNVFGICDVITREKHGDIDKFIGDAIMATFLDANDAVDASEKILHDALPHFNELRVEQGGEPIRIRIGINSGNVVQGDIGTTDRKDMTVVGDVVNTAQRIESACPPNSLLISEATFARLTPSRADRFFGKEPIKVKGKAEVIKVFELRE